MNSLRQSIEHDYAQWKQTFSSITQEKHLRIRKSRVGHFILSTLIMHNAYLCLNGGITALRFQHNTPSLQEWTHLGKKGKPRSFFQGMDINVQQWLAEGVNIQVVRHRAANAQFNVEEEEEDLL